MKSLYINGKQASLWQKLLFTAGTIGFLILIIPLGLGILAIGMICAAIFYLYLYFKIRKMKKMFNVQQETYMSQQKNEQTTSQKRESSIDGEYKEL